MKRHLKWIVPVIVVLVIIVVIVQQSRRGDGEANAQTASEGGETILGGRTGTCETGDISVLLTEVGEI